MSKNITQLFKSLYSEFIDYLNKTGLSNRVLTVIDGKPTIDFQFTIHQMGDINYAIETLSKLPSYDSLVEEVAKIESISTDEVRRTSYGLFGYLFSDLASYINPPQPTYVFANGKNIQDLTFDEKKLSHAIRNAVSPDSYYTRKNNYFIIFENIEIPYNIVINNKIKLVKLSRSDIESKFSRRYDSNRKWARVYSAFQVDETYLKNQDFIPVLSTLLRIFNNNGDLRFKAIYQEAEHLVRGEIYINHKNSFSEHDYHENAPSVKDDAWRQYAIKETDIQEFSDFINTNLQPMFSMVHSCKMYNMVFSSPLHLRIPLLFFVIESFFSDVNSEVVFRIALYLTVLLKEDENFRKKIKSLYGIRSSIAHGDIDLATKNIKKMGLSGFTGANQITNDILIRLWKQLLSINWSPKESGTQISGILLRTENT